MDQTKKLQLHNIYLSFKTLHCPVTHYNNRDCLPYLYYYGTYTELNISAAVLIT